MLLWMFRLCFFSKRSFLRRLSTIIEYGLTVVCGKKIYGLLGDQCFRWCVNYCSLLI